MFTLILPALLREPHETLPELHTPALNQLLRYARVQPTAYSRMQLYQTYLCDQLGQPENSICPSGVVPQSSHLRHGESGAHTLCACTTATPSSSSVTRRANRGCGSLKMPSPPRVSPSASSRTAKSPRCDNAAVSDCAVAKRLSTGLSGKSVCHIIMRVTRLRARRYYQAQAA